VCGDQDVGKTLAALQAAGQATYQQYKDTGASMLSLSGLGSMAGAGKALQELAGALMAENLQASPATFLNITERLRTRRTANALTKVRPRGAARVRAIRALLANVAARCGAIMTWIHAVGLHPNARLPETIPTDADTERSAMQAVATLAPSIADVLVHDRDRIMTDCLYKLASEHAAPLGLGPRAVVAVVGLAHLDGIERRWADRLPAEGLASASASASGMCQ
jgi:hypothetical protein